MWGNCLASLDKIKECEMPELEEGDLIYFDNMGAYSVVLSSPFIGFERPHIYYCIIATKRLSSKFKITMEENILACSPLLYLLCLLVDFVSGKKHKIEAVPKESLSQRDSILILS